MGSSEKSVKVHSNEPCDISALSFMSKGGSVRNQEDPDQGQIHINITLPIPLKEWGELEGVGVIPGGQFWHDKGNEAFIGLRYLEDTRTHVSISTIGGGIHLLPVTVLLSAATQAVEQSASLCLQVMQAFQSVCQVLGLRGEEGEYEIADLRIRLDARGNRIGLIEIHVPKAGYQPITPRAAMEEGKLKRLIQNYVEDTIPDVREGVKRPRHD